jgi:hypothetical protein
MECFQKEDTLVDISIGPSERLTVCGDIHGQFSSLIDIFDDNGYPSETHKYVQFLRSSAGYFSFMFFSYLMATLWIEAKNR